MFIKRIVFCLAAAILVFAGAFAGYVFLLPVPVVINDTQQTYAVKSRAADVKGLLEEQGIELTFHDKFYPGMNTELTAGMEIRIERTVPILLIQPGAAVTYYTTASTVQGALLDMDVPLDGSYFVDPQPEEPISPAMEITLVPRHVVTEFAEEKIPFETEGREDPELFVGRRLIVREGKTGLKQYEYRVVYADDTEFSRELIRESVVKEPVNAIVTIGTKEFTPPPVLLASRGERVYEYSSEGIASCYGSKFHGRRTSSGEVYNQHDFTAAHRYLPFGTVVKVTSLDTGKSVGVTINDRGPLKPERIIDLSIAAAEAIGMNPAGIGRVRIEAAVDVNAMQN